MERITLRLGNLAGPVQNYCEALMTDLTTSKGKDMVTQFDNYEIRHCAEFPDGDGGTFTEPLNGMSEDDALAEGCVQTFWTLYGHVTGHGCEALLDRSQFVEVRHAYRRITGNNMPDAEQDYTALPA